MQSTVTTPQPKPRRNPRRQKAKNPSQSINTQKGAEASSEANSIQSPTMSNLSQQIAALAEQSTANADMNNPLTTPPRTCPMYDSPSMQEAATKGLRSGNASAIESDGHRRKSLHKPQNRHSTSYSNSNTNGTPQRKKSQTPRKASATPSQAYAGPTFHASPAPSSLPMPKFFSKSVPEVNKANGLSAMMENEVSEGAMSQGSSDGSPMLDKAERVQQQTREQSPLDIFFKADRNEKARARQINSKSPLVNGTNSDNSSRTADTVPANPSSLFDPVRHHFRHPTDGSTNGLFPIDLEDERSSSPANQSKLLSHPTALNRATSAPSGIKTESQQDEAAKRSANSLALKKLLMTPQPQRPVPIAIKEPMSEGRKQHTPPVRESSGPFASSPTAKPKVQILSRKQPASLPQLQQQFGSTPSDSSPRPRPPSSNLRKELSAPQSPVQNGVSELPASPTPSRGAGPFPPPNPRSQHDVIHNTTFSPLRPTAFPSVGSPSIRATNDVSSMENELKRVLKLDILGSDGASGVRS